MPSRVVSVNRGCIRPLEWRGEMLRSAIVKTPVDGPVQLTRLGMQGNQVGNRKVHGGVDKAVYLYPLEHYDYWRETLGRPDLAPGGFGENLTITGLDEDDLAIGDRLRIGHAVLEISQPRLPCKKLMAHMGRADMGKLFLASERTGFYARVITPGSVKAGYKVRVVRRVRDRLTVRELTRMMGNKDRDPERRQWAAGVEGVPGRVREQLVPDRRASLCGSP